MKLLPLSKPVSSSTRDFQKSLTFLLPEVLLKATIFFATKGQSFAISVLISGILSLVMTFFLLVQHKWSQNRTGAVKEKH